MRSFSFSLSLTIHKLVLFFLVFPIQRIVGIVKCRHQTDVRHPNQFIHGIVKIAAATQQETRVAQTVEVAQRVARRVHVQVGAGRAEVAEHAHGAGAVGGQAAAEVGVQPVAAGRVGLARSHQRGRSVRGGMRVPTLVRGHPGSIGVRRVEVRETQGRVEGVVVVIIVGERIVHGLHAVLVVRIAVIVGIVIAIIIVIGGV